MKKNSSLVLLVFASAATGVAMWALLHFTAPKPDGPSQSDSYLTDLTNSANPDLWERAIEKVKEDRVEPAGGQGAVVPPELQHYEDRHWFLATQVAEVRKLRHALG